VSYRYILTDTNNDQAFGPYQSEYDAANNAVDLMLEFGEITRAEGRAMKKDLNTKDWREVLDNDGWGIWPLRAPSDKYV
jgi:hypothetical protein